MIYTSQEMEEKALLEIAAEMCAAARTAPKAKGIDTIYTMVLTGEDQEALAQKMEEMAERDPDEGWSAWYKRDAMNLRDAQAVVLIGAKRTVRGVSHCGYCGFSNCESCQSAGGTCAFAAMDLGIAIASAVSRAADARVDNRIMMSIGKAAEEMHYPDKDILWQGIPLSITGKNIFFDRNRK